MWSTHTVWKKYNKMAVLHFFLVNSPLIYILFSLWYLDRGLSNQTTIKRRLIRVSLIFENYLMVLKTIWWFESYLMVLKKLDISSKVAQSEPVQGCQSSLYRTGPSMVYPVCSWPNAFHATELDMVNSGFMQPKSFKVVY